jgi:hypothetical protein
MYSWYKNPIACNMYLSEMEWEGQGWDYDIIDETDLQHFRDSQMDYPRMDAASPDLTRAHSTRIKLFSTPIHIRQDGM